VDDIKQKAIGVTDYAFKLPPYRRTVAYTIIFAAAAGIFAYALERGLAEPAAVFIFGGAEGIVLIAFPALAAAALAATIASRKEFRKGFNRFSFIALVSCIIYSASLLATLALAAGGLATKFFEHAALVVIANAFILVVWFIASFIAMNYGKKSFLLSVFHPLLNLAFLVIWQGYGVVAPSIEVGSPWIGFVRMLFAALIMMFAVGALFFVINAPAKRNFGISSIQATALFLAQWHSGEKGLEEVLAEMSEKAQTYVGIASFKTLKGKQKAVFVAPYVHFGPMGNIGGSEFPFLLANAVEKHCGAPALVFHTTAYHDFNPVYSSSAKYVASEINALVDSAAKFDDTASLLSAEDQECSIAGMAFGKNCFLTLSRAPHATDDFELALGLALVNKAKSRGFDNVLLFDRHNSKAVGGTVNIGSKAFYCYEDAIEKLSPRPAAQKKFRLGVSHDPLPGFTCEDGIGKAGLKVAVFDAGGKKACFVLLDANNCLASFRQAVLDALKRFNFDFCDVMTTDTHAVNKNTADNSLGTKQKHEELVPAIEAAVERAVADLEPCKAAFAVKRIELDVLGARRSSELLSTINSVVAVLKILAPTIFVASTLVALATLFFLK